MKIRTVNPDVKPIDIKVHGDIPEIAYYLSDTTKIDINDFIKWCFKHHRVSSCGDMDINDFPYIFLDYLQEKMK